MSDVEEEPGRSRSTLINRNVRVRGRRTSVRLEPAMWGSLKEIAKREGCGIHDICSLVDEKKKPEMALTAAIRVFVILYFRAAATEEGHAKAGHGSFAGMVRRAHREDAKVAAGEARKFTPRMS
ncbi:ribbon-helix-helix domain-containing protein [Hyphomicrobium sp. MC8b]|uniref:ribbon-helix-helix domain-containing protein n=1 Tax=Hyphomicrobium sp. MC8b TaxID=300273 RepID=UPI003919210F